MSERVQIQAKLPSANSLTPVRNNLLQRKCACGGTSDHDGECASCDQERAVHQVEGFAVARTVQGIPRLFNQPLEARIHSLMEPRFGHSFGSVRVHTDVPRRMWPKSINGRPVDGYEQEAERAAAQALHGPEPGVQQSLTRIGPMIQRSPDDGVSVSEPAQSEPFTEAGVSEQPPARDLILEDSTDELGTGQMRRSEFLDQLRAAVRGATDSALVGTGCSSEDCPYIGYWFGYYGARDSRHVERAIHRYAPETRDAATAQEYIYLVTARVRRAVEVWAETGQVTGVPEDVQAGTPAGVPAKSTESPPEPSGEISLKARDGSGTREAGDLREIRARLGAGHALDGDTRSRMESAFGVDFSRVRVHAGAGAAAQSARLGARAFTIGSDIAFGAREYRPGTPVGDALLAHELAHVVQQGAAGTAITSRREWSAAAYGSAEEDADRSAAGAVVSLWGRAKGVLAEVAGNALPRLRAGLALQRCACSLQSEKEPPEKRFLTGPRDEPYKDLLKEASQDLERVGFGRAEKTKRSHSEYWDVIEPRLELMDGRWVRDESKYKLILKDGKKLSEALDGLVRDAREAKSQDVWLTASLDCTQFVQAVNLTAVRRRLGSESFDKKVDEIQKRLGPFEITTNYSGAHYLALVTPNVRFSRERDGSALFQEYTWKDGRWEGGTEVRKTTEELLKEAPVGSRVTWKNSAADPGSSFYVENTIKVDDDLYAAHGFTPGQKKNIFSRAELERALAPSRQVVEKELGDTVNAASWIDDFIQKFIFVTEIEHYRLPEAGPITGPAK